MCDCDFTTAAPETAPLSPHKRVRYSPGLVLGVDELDQEQLYLMERDRLHQRALHGYGTAFGLGVEVAPDADGRPEVRVGAGLAVTPCGETVCVPQTQCARLDAWLEGHREDLLGSPPGFAFPSSPPAAVSLWVVLCPRDCETDPVPVLGDPCRTPEDATVASRIADDFQLSFTLAPPAQLEEDAVRLLGALLHAVEVSELPGPAGFLTPADLAARVALLVPVGSPPVLPTLAELLGGASPVASPATALADAHLHPDDTAAALAAVWQTWVTVVRPRLTVGCRRAGEPCERCLRLARLDVSFEEVAGRLQVAGAVGVDESDRPLLLHTRLLQELAGWGTELLPPGSPFLPPPAPPGGSPASGSPSGILPLGPIVHADLDGLAADDHPQYLLVDPATRALVADLAADGHRLGGLPPAAAAGEAVPFEQAVKVGDDAGGDLAGTYPDPVVAALRGQPLAAIAPGVAGMVLTWDGLQWIPSLPPPAPPGPQPDLLDAGLVRIVSLSWAHGGPSHTLQLVHNGAAAFGLAIAFGSDSAPSANVSAGTLNGQTVRLWTRQQVGGGPFFQHLEVRATVVPAEVVRLDAANHIIETRSHLGRTAPAVVLLLTNADASTLIEARTPLTVELRGEFILDPGGRAIDGEHVRGELPTGAGARGARLGVQGGRFESWIGTGRLIFDGIDINSATAEEMTGLTGLGDALAKRVVETRATVGGFRDLDDLTQVSGISERVLARLAPSLGKASKQAPEKGGKP